MSTFGHDPGGPLGRPILTEARAKIAGWVGGRGWMVVGGCVVVDGWVDGGWWVVVGGGGWVGGGARWLWKRPVAFFDFWTPLCELDPG